MPSGDTLQVALFFIALAAEFFVATLRPEERWIRNSMRIAAGALLLTALAWPLLINFSPTFAGSIEVAGVVP